VIAEALRSPHDVTDLFITSDAPAELAVEARGQGALVHEVGPGVLRSLTDTVTSQGAVAVVSVDTVSITSLGSPDLVLVLAEVRDPGNAGTLARSALAAGASAVVFVTGTVDPFGPKTIRASAGAIFRLPIVTNVALDEALEGLRTYGLWLVGTRARAKRSLYEVDLRAPVAIVVGNEAWGLPNGAGELVDEVVSIPMRGPVDSINAGIAGSVMLFEAARQRAGVGR
jgi:RNA methyltransferase, TrmH family